MTIIELENGNRSAAPQIGGGFWLTSQGLKATQNGAVYCRRAIDRQPGCRRCGRGVLSSQCFQATSMLQRAGANG